LARRVVFLAYGESKSEAVRHVLEEPLNVEAYPAQLISPEKGERVWFLDERAASEIWKREHHIPAAKHTKRKN
jgi:6-phosphogluconolactonase